MLHTGLPIFLSADRPYPPVRAAMTKALSQRLIPLSAQKISAHRLFKKSQNDNKTDNIWEKKNEASDVNKN